MVSDLTPGLDGTPNRVGADHVLGISSASTSLAQLTIRQPVERALDLGTGCGVQALHLARHARRVVATDVNARALWITGLNAALNEAPNVEVRDGSFFEPVAGEAFDLIATNPPFVISPATGERLVYRDSGLPGDRVVEDIVRAAPAHLAPGGWCQVLANWVVARGRPWEERLAGWVEGCDAWSSSARSSTPRRTSRCGSRTPASRAAPTTYVATTRGCRGSRSRASRRSGSAGSTFAGPGWTTRRSAARSGPTTWSSRSRRPSPPGAPPSRGCAGSTTRAGGRHLVARADVRQETLGQPGAADPETIVLRQQRGLRRARTVDTVEAALVGACDGDLSVDADPRRPGRLLDLDPAEARTTYLPVVRTS